MDVKREAAARLAAAAPCCAAATTACMGASYRPCMCPGSSILALWGALCHCHSHTGRRQRPHDNTPAALGLLARS